MITNDADTCVLRRLAAADAWATAERVEAQAIRMLWLALPGRLSGLSDWRRQVIMPFAWWSLGEPIPA
jgi:hypothetical protein